MINSHSTKINNYSKISFGYKQKISKNLTTTIKRNGSSIDYDSIELNKIKAMIKKGYSLNDIGVAIGEKINTVRTILQHFKIKTKDAEIIEKTGKAKIVEMLEKGMSQKEIAKALGLKNAGGLTPILKEIGANATQSKVKNITKFEIETLIMMKKNIEEIANHFNVSPRFISQKIKELGIKTSYMEKTTKTVSVNDIIEAVNQGLTKTEIIKRYNISLKKLNEILADLKIKTAFEKEIESRRVVDINELKAQLKICRNKNQIAKNLNISYDEVTRLLEKYKLKINPNLPPTEAELIVQITLLGDKKTSFNKEFFEMTLSKRSSGMNYIGNAICSKFKITPNEFKKLIKKYNLSELIKENSNKLDEALTIIAKKRI